MMMEKLLQPSGRELSRLLLPEWCRRNFSSDNSATTILLGVVSAFRDDLNHPNRTNTAKVTEDLVKAVQLGHFGPFSTVVGFSLRCFSYPGPIWATKLGLQMYNGTVGTFLPQKIPKACIGPHRTHLPSCLGRTRP